MLGVDERACRVEEMTGSAPEDRHTMSLIAGFLDNETLKHTMQYQGMGKSVTVFKRKILEFVNLTMPTKSDAMDIGRVETRGVGRGTDPGQASWDRLDEAEWDEEPCEAEDDGYLNGFGEKCYNCGGYGH